MLSTISVIAVLFVIVTIVFSYYLREYYYQTAENEIDYKVSVSSLKNYFSSYIGLTDNIFIYGAQSYLESFEYKNEMEVWIIGADGLPIMSSTGFDVDETQMPDYIEALASDSGEGLWIGEYSTGELVLAKTFLISSSQDGYAVRFIISLEDLNYQHNVFTCLIIIICIISLSLVYISGLYFIRSIVRPVNKISESAKRLAAGDFNAKVEISGRNDEIDRLSESFNYMSDEIARTDKLKNDFISTVSHELRTPLTVIKGWGETLLNVGSDDKELTNQALGIIVNETERLNGIVEDLLDFSKMQNGTLTLRKERIDILAELQEAVLVFQDRAKRENIVFNYEAPDGFAILDADPDRIKQVFVNILDNAFKYNNAGGKVYVFSDFSADRKNIIISVADTGCGISSEDLPHVKEKFYKANISVRGSGIGLAVVDEIVKLHGGTFDISSILGTGTVVTLTFPIERA